MDPERRAQIFRELRAKMKPPARAPPPPPPPRRHSVLTSTAAASLTTPAHETASSVSRKQRSSLENATVQKSPQSDANENNAQGKIIFFM